MKSLTLKKTSTHELALGDYIILPHEDWLRHSFSHNEFFISSEAQISDLLADGVDVVWRRSMSDENASEVSPEANRFASGIFVPTTSRTRGEGIASKKMLIQNFRDGLPFLRQEASVTMKSLAEVKNKIKKTLEEGTQEVLLSQVMSEYEILFSRLYSAILANFSGYAYIINTGICAPQVWDVHARMGVLAGALAHTVGFDEQKVKEMVLIGLLHDVGQVRSGCPPEKQDSNNKRFIAWQASVAKHGEEMLREANFSDGVIRGLASQFEIYYGGGTPSGVSGKDIPAEARLLHIVRTYCQYLGDGKLRLCPHKALSIMFFDFRNFFDDEYLTCFLKLLGVYPVGTYIKISGEKIGVVVGYSEDLQHISTVTHEEGISNSEVMPSLLGDIGSKIIEDIPPYRLSKEKTKYFSFA